MMNVDDVLKLIEAFRSGGLSSLKWKQADSELVLKNGVAPVVQTGVGPSVAGQADSGAGGLAVEQELPELTEAEDESKREVIKAPVVGVFFAAPSPEDDVFVEVGSEVEAGDVLCIIEAMKLMNEVVAETSGTIREVLVNNGEKVEYGQAFFVIEPAEEM